MEGVACGCGEEQRRRSRLGNKKWQPTQQMLASCCGLLCVWGTPRRRGRQGNVFRSPVILHNAGQIRLKLTAEDIQLDCACHSVASIRVSPHAFVFAIATRENTARCLFVSFPFMSTSSSRLLHYFHYWMLHVKYWHSGPCKFLICIVHFSDAITWSDPESTSAWRRQIKTELSILRRHWC